jgi:hypothetical protein
MNVAQSTDIDSETSAVGIIARLEHTVDRMDASFAEHRRRVIDARVHLATPAIDILSGVSGVFHLAYWSRQPIPT